MSESTPPPYANYPRNTPVYGTSAQLQALADGYWGLSKVFVINIVLAIAANVFLRTAELSLVVVLLVIAAFGTVIGFLTYPYNKKIGFGANWASSQAIVASVLMGINSALCCGIIGYAVMQTIAVNHIKKYGLKSGFMGIKKREVLAKVAELQSAEGSGQPRF